jgi:hypothetical protein
LSDIKPLPLAAGLSAYERQAIADFEGSQSALAEWYQFDGWETLARWVAEVTRQGSGVWQFETAVEAIIAGDESVLGQLLHENPDLVRHESLRTHGGTLLIYVGANGVEGYRQRTPPNAVRIAEILLDAGAEIDFVGKMYRGTTTLGLVATSVHPVNTGVQEELMQFLLDRGASMDRAVAADYTEGFVVKACLANGRPAAARYLADHGAKLDLDGAAGVGRLDIVRSYFSDDGAPRSGVTPERIDTAFHWACGYGHIDVVDYLIDKTADINSRFMGETPLHWAAGSGDLDVVARLVEHGAQVNAKDVQYDATPLEWALYGWMHPARDGRPGNYHGVVRLLAAAGSSIHPEWLQEPSLRNDVRMLEALGPLAA